MSNLKNTIGSSKRQEPIYEIRVRRLDGFVPPPHHVAMFRKAGDFLTMDYTENKVLGHIRRVSKTHYENIQTGELHEYQQRTDEERWAARKQNLKRTFAELKAVLRENFTGCEKSALFITLTYAENMTNEERLYADFKQFMKELRCRYPDHDFEYVTVAEPQGRGAWHIHMMLKSTNTDSLYIHDSNIRKCWRRGITDTQQLKTGDIGRYYTAYFTGIIKGADYELDELTTNELTSSEIYEAEQAIVKADSKAYIKGQRLHMYPKGFRLYRRSRGIVKPQKEAAIIGDDSEGLTLEVDGAYAVEKKFNQDHGKNKAGDIVNLNNIYKATYRIDNAESFPDKLATAIEQMKEGYDWSKNIVIQAKERIRNGGVQQCLT